MAMVLEILMELFFTRQRIDDPLFSDADIFLHLADDLFCHPFGVFHPVNQIIQIGRQDITDTLKNIWHTAFLSVQKLRRFL